MFSFLKRKKKELNRAFGAVHRYDGYWSTSVKAEIVLWGKCYQLSCMVAVARDQAEITKAQEDTYLRFKDNCSLLGGQIERIVENYFDEEEPAVLLEKFTPYQMIISPQGECAIVAHNADDEDMDDVLPGLAVVLYPTLAIFTKEDYTEYAFHGGCNKIREILYGG